MNHPNHRVKKRRCADGSITPTSKSSGLHPPFFLSELLPDESAFFTLFMK
jgi:hypothetical protein